MRQRLWAHGGSGLAQWLYACAKLVFGKRSDAWLCIFAGVVSVVFLALLTTYPWGRDQSIYAVVGQGVLHHQVPYRDLWDFKPPGIFFVYAIAHAWFGESMAAIRWLEVSGLGVAAACLIVLARRFQGNSLAGWFAAAFMISAHALLDFWHTAQPETFGGILTVGALTLIVPRTQHPTRALHAALAGVLLGAAGLMKPQLAGGLIVFAAYVLRQAPDTAWLRRIVPLLALGAGSLATWLACAAYFVLHGAWGDFWWTMHDFVPGYTALGWNAEHAPLAMFHYALVELLTKFSVFFPIGITATLVLPSAHSREHEGTFLLAGLIAFHAVGIALQAKFFQYHYDATLPLVALLAGFGWAKLWRTALLRGWVSISIFAVAALLSGLLCSGVDDLPGTGWLRARSRLRFLLRGSERAERQRLDSAIARVAGFDLGADREVATWISGQTGPGDSILVWGFEPAIYWLAQRKPATRFIYDVPQRTAWQRQTSQLRFMQDVRKNRPVVIVVQHADIIPAVTGGMGDSAADLSEFPEFAHWLEVNYNPAGYRFNFEYFRIRATTPTP